MKRCSTSLIERNMKIKGIVTNEATLNEDTAMYSVSMSDNQYVIESSGRQAVKDYIFIREGQLVEVEGTIKDKCIVSQKTRIEIKEYPY